MSSDAVSEDWPRSEKERQLYEKYRRQAKNLVHGELLLHENQFMPPPNWWVRWKLRRTIKLYLKVLQLRPADWTAMWLIGKATQRIGDERGGFDWFVKAWDLKPQNANVAREAALSAMKLGLGKIAVEYCEEALTVEPGEAGLLSNLALAQLHAGCPHDALETVRAALEADPHDEVTASVHRVIKHILESKAPCPRNSSELARYCKAHQNALREH